MIDEKQIARNLQEVHGRIAAAASVAGRDSDDMRLVVVTKGHTHPEIFQTLHSLGEHDLGESYVDEALAKQAELAVLPGWVWHMIGHVQSRKAAQVAANFDLVHSVDSLKLAARLDRFAADAGRKLSILLECNVGGEASKHGWPAASDAHFDAALPEIEQVLQLPNVQVRGLMSMAPMNAAGDQARPYFARTRQLRDRLAQRFPAADWRELSMGMSGDFEAAVMEGATLVRIGTAIVGERR